MGEWFDGILLKTFQNVIEIFEPQDSSLHWKQNNKKVDKKKRE